MRLIICVIVFLASYGQSYSRPDKPTAWMGLISSSDIHLKSILTKKGAKIESAEVFIKTAILSADQHFSMGELTAIVTICARYCNKSQQISVLLTKWLRENQIIYADRTPTEVSQFRGFLLATLGGLPPNDELYKYIKFEFTFADHNYEVTAAASTAKSFPDKINELLPLMQPFLLSGLADEKVDITTPELNYPVKRATTLRYEIIKTLVFFGPKAYPSVNLLRTIVAGKENNDFGADPQLYKMASNAAKYITAATPPCCRKESVVIAPAQDIGLINKNNRKAFSAAGTILLDQEGHPLKLNDFKGKPFILTFFYTQCTNQLKCISTVHRLGELETACIKSGIDGRVAILGMTYDPGFDSPSVLKKYGQMYGIKFNENLRLVKTANNTIAALSKQLQLRVNYGAGSVNQHGVQLFVFDKEGQIAGMSDNDLWTVNSVKKCLNNLLNE